MIDRDKKDGPEDRSQPASDKPTKPAGQEVGPPSERVDDEVGGDEGTITRQE